MLKDEARKVIDSELKYGEERELYHYNCSETIFHACNAYYNLNLDSKTLKAIIPFGGGLCCEKTCGLLSGGIAALGVMFSEDKPSTNKKVKELTKKWVCEFEKEFGDINCKKIKEKHSDEKLKCEPVMLKAAEIFERVIQENK